MAEANEPPADAVCRELREELGLDIQVGDLLCVDWVSPHGPWDDLLPVVRAHYPGLTARSSAGV
jgi:8-oxo-dGTP diphosphatase